jgi:hypothetical protein
MFSKLKLLISTIVLFLAVGCADEQSKPKRDGQSLENLEVAIAELQNDKKAKIPKDVDFQCPELFVVSPNWVPSKIDGWSHLKPQPEKYFTLESAFIFDEATGTLVCDYLPHRKPWGTYIRQTPTGTKCTVKGDTFHCRIPSFTDE